MPRCSFKKCQSAGAEEEATATGEEQGNILNWAIWPAALPRFRMDEVVDPATLETQVMDGETFSVDMTLARQIRGFGAFYQCSCKNHDQNKHEPSSYPDPQGTSIKGLMVSVKWYLGCLKG